MRKRKQENGYTLIEMTVILGVVTVLSGMLAPSILQFIEDSKITRARSDVQMIATSLTRFYQDTGYFPVTSDSVSGGPGTEFLEVLISKGALPRVGQATAASHASYSSSGSVRMEPAITGQDVERWNVGTSDVMENYLTKNRPGFTLRGPGNTRGWNGPYLNTDISADPWGNHYAVNVAYLDTDSGVADAQGNSKNAVFVLSAGPNQTIETPFSQPITNAELFGDDIGARVR